MSIKKLREALENKNTIFSLIFRSFCIFLFINGTFA